MSSWKTLARKPVADFGKWLIVENHTVELHDGRIIENWPYIVTPDYINVMVETDDGKFICFRQTKYTIDGMSLAPVGGYIEPGEPPLITAQRELLEETGYHAREWIALGKFIVDPNRGPMVGNLFLARGAHRIAESNPDDLEEQTMLLLTRSEIASALEHGAFKVLAWQAVMALGLIYLDKHTEEIMSEIKHFPKTTVAFVTEVGPWNVTIQRGFGRLFAWVGANHVQPLGPSLGIFYDDPAKVPAEKLRCDLCVPVAPNTPASGDVHVKEIGDVDVATLVYQGDQNITRAYNEMYDWLHAQGYHETGAPMETYLSMPGEELRAEIAVPVTKVVARKPAAKKSVVKQAAKKPVKKPAAKKMVKKVAKKPAKKE